MVHIAENSLNCIAYRELNQQLARENGELRQQLSQALRENDQHVAQIIQLHAQLREMDSIKHKYDLILDVITSKEPQPTFETPQKSIESLDTSPTIGGLERISEHSETYNDSLDPPDVTSVPPLNLQPERNLGTPSIFNCLDESSPKRHNQDMFQSTPVQKRVPLKQKENLEVEKKQPKQAAKRELEQPRYNLRKRNRL